MSPLLSGLVGAIIAYALVTLAERRHWAGYRGSDGWTVLRPGALIKFAILLCAVLTALIGYFFWSGGSTRADAATQDLYALSLLFVFAAGAVYLLWISYARTVAWKDDELRIRRAFSGETVQRFSDVASAEKSDSRGEYRLRFRDGSALGFSVYFDGARELIDQLPEGVVRERGEDWS
jgi:hypothetical protein